MLRLYVSHHQHELVFVGATIGREFTFQMMRLVTQLDDATLFEELEKLVHAEIAFRDGTPPLAHYTFKHALIQDAAYTSMLKKRRQDNHLKIAEVLEAEFSEVVESQPELVAHHFTEANDITKAVSYWLKAGQRSQSRSANHEAIEHYRNGLRVIEIQDESADRDQQENNFQLALVGALVGAKGYAAPEVNPTLDRTRELSERLGEPTTLMIVLWFTWAMSLIRSELDQAVDDVAEMLALAERTGDDGLLMEALFGRSPPVSSAANSSQYLRQGNAASHCTTKNAAKCSHSSLGKTLESRFAISGRAHCGISGRWIRH